MLWTVLWSKYGEKKKEKKNSLKSQSTHVWKFFRMLYFHLVWCMKSKLTWVYNFFWRKILLVPKKSQPFRTKKNQNFNNLVTLLLFLMLLVSQAAICRCSTKYLFLKVMQNSQKNTYAGVSFLKHTISSETIFGNWKSLKNVEECFLFHPKDSFYTQDNLILCLEF